MAVYLVEPTIKEAKAQPAVSQMVPATILGFLGETAEGIFAWVVGVVEWAVPYLVLGAAVVLPIWLIMAAWRFLRSKNG